MFSVVESDTGRVVTADAVGVAELEHRLWAIARDRRRSIDPDRSQTCQTCGAPRVGNFRWCKGCGSDFESDHGSDSPSTQILATSLPATTRPEALAAPVRVPSPAGPATRDPTATSSGWLLEAPDEEGTPESSPRIAASATAIASPRRSAPPPKGAPPAPAPSPSPTRAASRAKRPSRLARLIDELVSDEWLTPDRVRIAIAVGLGIGIVVTIVLLALD